MIIYVLDLCKNRDTLLVIYCTKNDFYTLFPVTVTFDLLHSNLLSQLLVSWDKSLLNLKFQRISDFE